MNTSSLKKTVMIAILATSSVGLVNAKSMQKDTTMSMSSATTPKIFGGSGQYRTWSIGVNAGVTSGMLAIGGSNSYKTFDPAFAYGLSIKDQLAHSFGLQLDVMGYGSEVAGKNTVDPLPGQGPGSFLTRINYSATLSGVVNVATVDFLARKNSVNFYVSAGAGIINYLPKAYKGDDQSGLLRSSNNGDGLNQVVIPIGVGMKFRLSDRVALNLGYTANFLDGDYFDATKSTSGSHKDKFSYAYGGLEFSLGSSAKPNLDWVNPVALMYDELKDPTLRQEVEALKGRVNNVETAVSDMKKDSDGDGVADQFDKCPNTPAGTVVDGAGCPIKFPTPDTTKIAAMAPMATAYSNIQFEFDSSVLRTSSYPVLDATSADLRAAKSTVWVNGFASSEGTASHNMQLSKDRASSVKTYLINSGVDAKRVKIKGMGETHPIADNSTEDGRVLNRRVEFKK
jgi:OOP family OmpA-OmpF porin